MYVCIMDELTCKYYKSNKIVFHSEKGNNKLILCRTVKKVTVGRINAVFKAEGTINLQPC